MNHQYDAKVQPDTKRPFRIYNATTKKFLPWRCYKHVRNAHMGAMVDCRWAAVGHTLEVVDVSIMQMHGQYRRGTNDIKFFKG